MLQIDTNQPINYHNQSSLLKTSSCNIEQLSNIRPRLCTLHKWSHYEGYGVHLGHNENWHGLLIDDVEPNSPAENGGLLRKDIVLAVNGHYIENDDFFVILSFIQHELEQGQIRFLVLDPDSAELARRYHININENNDNCIRLETSEFIESPNKILNNANNSDQTMAQNSSHDGLDSDLSPNNNLKSEPRTCSVTLGAGIDLIGISLELDTDFGHIITQVDSNSPAGHAGIEQNDCIISVNNTFLLHKSFEDVLYFLKKSRNETKLDFLVAKKSYLLKSSEYRLTSNLNSDILSSTNLTEKHRSFTLPATQTLEQLYQKYTYGQLGQNQKRETILTITDEQYDYLSLQIYSNRYTAKHKKNHGRIQKGIGPATAHRYSWSVASEKTVDYSSIRSDLYGRRPGIEEIKKRISTIKSTFNALQVGITNPSPTQQSRRIPFHISNFNSSDNGQRTTQSPSSVRWHQNSPKVLPSPILALRNNHVVNTPSPLLKHNQTIQNIRNAVPITPVQPLPILRNREQG